MLVKYREIHSYLGAQSMAIVIPAVSAPVLLDSLLDGLATWVHLYQFDTELGPDTTLSDLIEADWPGYEPQLATGWTPALWVTDRAESSADPLVWAYGVDPSPTLIYGYFVTDGRAGELIWVERRPQGPVVLEEPGDPVEIFPRLTLRQDPDAE